MAPLQLGPESGPSVGNCSLVSVVASVEGIIASTVFVVDSVGGVVVGRFVVVGVEVVGVVVGVGVVGVVGVVVDEVLCGLVGRVSR